MISKEDLYKLYIEENKSLVETSEYFGVSKKIIRNKLKKYNIQKDPLRKKQAAIESRKKTCLEKYGVDNPSKSEEIINKIKNVFMDKYGVDNPFKSEEVKDKIRNTNIEKYGVPSPAQSKNVIDKIKKTSLERWGCENPAASEKIKQKIKRTFQDKYGVNSSFQLESVREKSKNTMLYRYGVENAGLMDDHREKLIQTLRGNENLTEICGFPISDLAEELGISKTTILRWNDKYNLTIDKLRELSDKSKRGFSSLEIYFQEKYGFEKYNIRPTSNINYRPDFKINDTVYLNVDGLYWHSIAKQEDKWYHFNMRKTYENNGLRIVQFRSDEVYQKEDIVFSMLSNLEGKTKYKIGARKTEISYVDNDTARRFLKENHIMGAKDARHIGLFYNDKLISILSFKIKNKELKIERFCSKKEYIVMGGLSRAVRYLEKNIDLNRISSWVDLRYGNGSSLEKIGFKAQKETLGWKWTDFKNTYNRLKCRANMDDRQLSEKEYAKELGWVKIYDAGQRLYSKEVV